jgi:hypothetical protein
MKSIGQKFFSLGFSETLSTILPLEKNPHFKAENFKMKSIIYKKFFYFYFLTFFVIKYKRKIDNAEKVKRRK